MISRAAARALADALLARGGEPVWVLDDELYRELTYVEDAGSLAAVYPYTIAINGLSKSNALTGMRIGWTIAPAPLCDELTKVHAWVTHGGEHLRPARRARHFRGARSARANKRPGIVRSARPCSTRCALRG